MVKLDLVDLFKKRTRHPFRPRASDVIDRLFPDFEPLIPFEGSLLAGSCRFSNKQLVVIAQQKPKPKDLQTSKDLEKLNYGMLNADDHSSILNILKKARLSDPGNTVIFSIIDTYGADISMYSAQRFQAFFIAHLIKEFLSIPIRTVSLILGEGGSGGALAIQGTDIRGQMDDALYATAPLKAWLLLYFEIPPA